MQKSIIIDILKGKRGHRETIRMTDAENAKMEVVSDIYAELKTKLTPEQWALLNKLDEALLSENVEELDHYYAEGFKLGLLIGIECAE